MSGASAAVLRKMQQVQHLTDDIAAARGVLCDQTSPANLIIRPEGHHYDAFRRRIGKLKQLEERRDRILQDIVNG